MVNMVNNDLIFEILICTNVIPDDSIVIEDCSSFNKELKGYYVVLERDSVHDARMFFTAKFTKRSDLIDNAFTSNSEKEIKQVIRSLETDLTKTFVKRAGGISNLISEGIPMQDEVIEKEVLVEESIIEEPIIENTYNEEEDEELIAELREEIEKLNSELESTKIKLEEVKPLIATYPEDTSDLDGDTIGFIMDKVEECDEETARSILNGMISKACDVNEKEVGKLLVAIATELSEVGKFE